MKLLHGRIAMEEKFFGYSNIFYFNSSKKGNKPSYDQCVVQTLPPALVSGRMCLKRKDVGQELMQLVVICIKFKICLIDFPESVLSQLLCLN